jgi:predicted double-glycine peptidase
MPPAISNGSTPRLLGANGQPIQDERGFVLPPYATFSAIFNSMVRTYRYTWDEAYKHSITNALAMRRNGFLMSLLRERQYPVAECPWHIEPEDDHDPTQKAFAEACQRQIKRTPNLQRLQMSALEALWYGRYGVQMTVVRDSHGELCITHHSPVNGDKVQINWDGIPQIAVHSGAVEDLKRQGADVIWAERWPLLRLGEPYWRDRFIIHQHEVDDADYFEGEMAGQLGGVGIRSRIYWTEFLKTELLSWVVDYAERVGQGLTVFFYESGNPYAQTQAETAVKQYSRNAVIAWPRPPGSEKTGNGVERIEVSMTGSEFLLKLIQYFDDQEERLVIGQSASSSSKTEGMGTHSTEFQQDTKSRIIRFDATNLQETMDRDLVGMFCRNSRTPPPCKLRWVYDLERPDPKSVLDAAKVVFDMGGSLKETQVLGLAGLETPKEGDAVLKGGGQAPGGGGGPGQPPPGGGLEPGVPPAGGPSAGPHLGSPGQEYRGPPGGHGLIDPKTGKVSYNDMGSREVGELERYAGVLSKLRRHWMDMGAVRYGQQHAPAGSPEGGQFTSQGGGGHEPDSGPHKPNEGGKHRPLHRKALHAAHAVLTDVRARIDHITDAPVLKQVKQGQAFLRRMTGKLYDGLESRYGRKQAVAIMASGQALAWGATGLGALAGVPVWLPGSSLWGSLPAAGLAEAYLRLSKWHGSPKVYAMGETGGQVEIHPAALAVALALSRRWRAYLERHREAIEATHPERYAMRSDQPKSLLNLPDVRQPDGWSCGAACAMSVGRYFGVGPESLDEWKALLGTQEDVGTPPDAIIRVLADLGLSVQAKENMTLEELGKCWENDIPVICPIQDYGGPMVYDLSDYGHYVIVIGADLDQVFIQDPNIDSALEESGADQTPGRGLIDNDLWMRVWHDKDSYGKPYVHYGIAISGRQKKYAKDAQGHEHAGKGEGGGQFVKQDGGGGAAEKGKEKPKAAEKPADKKSASERARESGGGIKGPEQDHAAKVADAVAEWLGGKREQDVAAPGQKDKKPFDVRVESPDGKTAKDVEVKALLIRKGNSISVHDDALLRKVDHGEATHNEFFTVVVDERDTFGGGAYKHLYSGNKIYFKMGSGRYSIKRDMYAVKDVDELKRLLATPPDKLPEKARGSLPPPPPLEELRKKAAEAKVKRNAKDKALKARKKDVLRAQANARAAKERAKRVK